MRAGTRPHRLSPPATARHERAGESDGGQVNPVSAQINVLFILNKGLTDVKSRSFTVNNQ